MVTYTVNHFENGCCGTLGRGNGGQMRCRDADGECAHDDGKDDGENVSHCALLLDQQR